jgi:prolyl-tRNA editing enzyme YbaK/EbsC (Cys-tRNA(Pro) deacylase)
MILAAGDAKVDNGKYKAFFGTKAKMLTPDEVESMIGHRIGGVCPFGINDGVKVYLDVSMKRFDYIYPAAGSSNSAIKLTMDELEKVSEADLWIDVCKLPEA